MSADPQQSGDSEQTGHPQQSGDPQQTDNLYPGKSLPKFRSLPPEDNAWLIKDVVRFSHKADAFIIKDIRAFLLSSYAHPVSTKKDLKKWENCEWDHHEKYVALTYNFSRDTDRICPECMRWGHVDHDNYSLSDVQRWKRSGTCSHACQCRLTAYLCSKAMHLGWRLDEILHQVWDRVRSGKTEECLQIWKEIGSPKSILPTPSDDIKKKYESMIEAYEEDTDVNDCLRYQMMSNSSVDTDFNHYIIQVTARLIMRQKTPAQDPSPEENPNDPKSSQKSQTPLQDSIPQENPNDLKSPQTSQTPPQDSIPEENPNDPKSSKRSQTPQVSTNAGSNNKLTKEVMEAPIKLFSRMLNIPGPTPSVLILHLEALRRFLVVRGLRRKRVIHCYWANMVRWFLENLMEWVRECIRSRNPRAIIGASEFLTNSTLLSLGNHEVISGSEVCMFTIWQPLVNRFLYSVRTPKLNPAFKTVNELLLFVRQRHIPYELYYEATYLGWKPIEKVREICSQTAMSFPIDESLLAEIVRQYEMKEDSRLTDINFFEVLVLLKEAAWEQLLGSLNASSEVKVSEARENEKYDKYHYESHKAWDTIENSYESYGAGNTPENSKKSFSIPKRPTEELAFEVAANTRIDCLKPCDKFWALDLTFRALKTVREAAQITDSDNLVSSCGEEILREMYKRLHTDKTLLELAYEMREFSEKGRMAVPVKNLIMEWKPKLEEFVNKKVATDNSQDQQVKKWLKGMMKVEVEVQDIKKGKKGRKKRKKGNKIGNEGEVEGEGVEEKDMGKTEVVKNALTDMDAMFERMGWARPCHFDWADEVIENIPLPSHFDWADEVIENIPLPKGGSL